MCPEVSCRRYSAKVNWILPRLGTMQMLAKSYVANLYFKKENKATQHTDKARSFYWYFSLLYI